MKLLLYLIIIKLFFSFNFIYACTGIFGAQNGLVLAGNNEDWSDPITYVWFNPSTDKKFGTVYFGFGDNFPQGGMNDQGLFFDAFATERLQVRRNKNKPVFSGNLADKVMSECSTVKEVIEVYRKYNLQFLEKAMYLFGDKTGNSVIIEGDDFVPKSSKYQIVTNFHQSKIKPDSITCNRYKIAKDMLEKCNEVSIDCFMRVLAATHQEGRSNTVYSNIYDLKKGLIYLYHYHNYTNQVIINLEDELKKGPQKYRLSNFFPRSHAYETKADLFE